MTAAPEPGVLVAIDDGIATVTLNRPDRLNAFNEGMQADFAQALDRIEGDDAVRALILTGSGRAFCAGQDLAERAAIFDRGEVPDLGAALDRAFNRHVRRLKALPVPVVSAVNGTAAGAGANLALACDIVLAARSARFVQSFAKVGLVPDSGGTWILPRLVGTARATALALLAEPVTAEQAEGWGMIWRAVDDDRLMDEAIATVRRLAAQPRRGLALTKRALAASAGNDLDCQLDLERDLQREAGRTDDYREAVTAFMAKRPPSFTGS
ncbi:MAG TPA: 2-(1,2-epoxy-1,2-dihydrophenyl)acetyl-CoA isomerase PaaG [Alphaproteobacteria bacterium]|nr:2-(1,2-epoxy-1,2-dihydrophenyl)acetyl-CoA isomerase PaaG [Alphaproteobacteria bacterium]